MNNDPVQDPSVYTVLVVDDTPATLRMLAQHLEANRLHVVVAEEGVEAVERARVVVPDLILLDVLMPGIDGFETCRRLKADELTRGIPVIFMTALADTQSKVNGFQLGGVDYVTKPIQLEEVLARVHTHLTLSALKKDLAQKVAERTAALARANRMLRILTECNQSLARANEEPELLREICRVIIHIGGYRLAWVGYAEKDATKSVRPIAQECAPGSEPFATPVTWADDTLGQHPAGTAIRTGQPAIVQYLLSNPAFAPWRVEAARSGLLSGISLPLGDDSGTFGALTLFAAQADAFNAEEISLLTELARDLAHGIRTLRIRAARTLAEEKLRQLKEFNEGIVQNMAEGLLVVDGQGAISYLNPDLEVLLRYAPGELLGRLWTGLIPPDQHKHLAQGPEGTIAPGRHELDLLRKDHTRVPVLASISRHASGKPAGRHLVVFTDLSERKRLESELIHAQKMEAVGRLAGGVAHDFNNLLTAIVGFADILRHGMPADDPRRGELNEIRKASERAAALIRQLLAFSRRQVLQPRVMDLNATIENLGKMLHRLIGEDIELRTELASPLPSIRADPGQIEQVLLNIAVNSRDAMPRGGVLTIRTGTVSLRQPLGDVPAHSGHAALRPGDYVTLTISDTGAGIPEEILPHIFEPFFTTKAEGRGTGLGLSTVYGIVLQSGGHIQAESRAGAGATFTIHLPAVAEQPAASAASQTTPPMAGAGSETILLVEDEMMVRNIVRRVLEMRRYTVLEAGTGADALALAEKHPGPIHLLLTDIILPGGMNGWELQEKLLPLRPAMKILCMSGYTHDAGLKAKVGDGKVPFLQKPFLANDLVQKVREVLDAAHGC